MKRTKQRTHGTGWVQVSADGVLSGAPSGTGQAQVTIEATATDAPRLSLSSTLYGPYYFCFDDMSQHQVLKRQAQSDRTAQIVEIVGKMKDQIANADEISVILNGDFNGPSHLDWTDTARSQHCNVSNVPWPSSVEPTKAGLLDSFHEIHEIHKNPLSEPGITWSSTYLDDEDRPGPMDLIDFVYQGSAHARLADPGRG